jgi:hypothetical protein
MEQAAGTDAETGHDESVPLTATRKDTSAESRKDLLDRTGWRQAATDLYERIREEAATLSEEPGRPPVMVDKGPPGYGATTVSLEGDSLEETVDEEEQILRDIAARRSGADEKEEEGRLDEVIRIETDPEPGETLEDLFSNADEIKKAIIYSEILSRKY